MFYKVVLAVVVALSLFATYKYVNSSVQPELGSKVVLDSLKRDNEAAVRARQYNEVWSSHSAWYVVGYLVFISILFGQDIYKGILKMKNALGLFLLLAVSLFSSGCAYNTPVFVTVENSETAFVIKLEGDNEQGTIESESFLKNNMVAIKRIPISYRWVSLGYTPFNGEFIPNERVVVVDRSPSTREWIPNKETHTGIWVESKDSVGFATGISITARIPDEHMATKFLYNYPPSVKRTIKIGDGYKKDYDVTGSNLNDVMDREVRTKIQEVFSEEAAKYNMDELRTKKNEIIMVIRDKVKPFFQDRGISITALGMFGGFDYENPNTQLSIDKVFQAQQDKQVAVAESQAAENRKVALRLVGEGEGAKVLERQKAEAIGIRAIADAKAYEIQQAKGDLKTYLALKALEVEQARLVKWDGKYPYYYLGGAGTGLNMFLPAPQPEQPVNTNR